MTLLSKTVVRNRLFSCLYQDENVLERWSGRTRNCDPEATVELNPVNEHKGNIEVKMAT
jgi:hypothetical protein